MANSNDLQNVPEAYICPITHTLMNDPYIDADGNSYEKNAILEWIQTNPCSPITRNHLARNQLVPNRVLKEIIDDFRAANGMAIPVTGTQRQAVVAPVENTQIDRKPLMLFTLIDCSGSMGTPCGQNASGESDGYNRMDLVKHTLNTIITSLTEHDKICIVRFSTKAEIFSQPTFCTESNKESLIQRVENIKQDGQTNIWDALRLCLDNIASQGSYANTFNTEVYLLTDGEPNINPPQPIVDTMKNYMRLKLKDVTNKPKISTFGYGYNLDSMLCYNLSQASNGIFGFIPDSTMVGTVFINALSQTLVGSNYDYDAVSEDIAITDMPIYDQIVQRAVAMLEVCTSVPLKGVPDRNVVVDFCTYITNLKRNLETNVQGNEEQAVQFLSDLLLDCSDSDDPNLGQIFKATDSNFFSKWGKHYLLSVLSAFKKRMCINFKDKAMQNFRSDKFIEEQQRIEDVFIQLPAPTPSCNTYTNHGGFSYGSSATPSAPPPVNMTSYYNSGGGCFTADSQVYVLNTLLCSDTDDLTSCNFDLKYLKDNDLIQLMPVADVRKDMLILSAMATNSIGNVDTVVKFSRVETIVKLPFAGDLYRVGALTLTPYHPILIGTDAQFPIESSLSTVVKPEEVVRDAGWVYDLVVTDRGLVVSSADDDSALVAATWGHTCTTGVFQHAYFGSEAIVADLKQLDVEGFALGFVCLPADSFAFKRDAHTMAVVSLQAVEVHV